MILAALRWQALSEQWQRDGGQFIPHPATYLNQGRWKDEQDRTIRTFQPKTQAEINRLATQSILNVTRDSHEHTIDGYAERVA